MKNINNTKTQRADQRSILTYERTESEIVNKDQRNELRVHLDKFLSSRKNLSRKEGEFRIGIGTQEGLLRQTSCIMPPRP